MAILLLKQLLTQTDMVKASATHTVNPKEQYKIQSIHFQDSSLHS
jgi:hypothetical protein